MAVNTRPLSLLPQGDRRVMYLQQMLVFSRHPNLQLSSLALPLWSSLLREALPHLSGGATVSPATAAAAVSWLTGAAVLQI